MQKERPINFNSEMVRAILEGRKTQTRRIVKNVSPDNCLWLKKPKKIKSGLATHVMDATKHKLCPYGNVGDHLWIRERFLADPNADHEEWDDHTITYFTWSGCGSNPADIPDKLKNTDNCIYKASWHGDDIVWHSPVRMPRWASRITVKITGVRVEKLNDISLVDAIAEGAPPSHPSINVISQEYGFPDFSRSWFAQIWDSIYGKGSWESNPWVWAISFEVLK